MLQIIPYRRKWWCVNPRKIAFITGLTVICITSSAQTSSDSLRFTVGFHYSYDSCYYSSPYPYYDTLIRAERGYSTGVFISYNFWHNFVFEPGFESYGELVAEIDPDLECTGGNKWDGNQSNDYIEEIITDSDTFQDYKEEVMVSDVVQQFEIYPNPNEGIFTITTGSAGNAAVYVYSLLGKLIHTTSLHTQVSTIDISNHPKGMYFVKVVQAGDIYIWKIIKQ